MLNTKSLREQVYEYLRDEISNRKLLPGATININEISQQFYTNAGGTDSH